MTTRAYDEVVSAAINDLDANGFDSVERVAYWEAQIRAAAEAMLGSAAQAEETLRRAMAQVYARLLDQGKVVQMHPGVERFTVERLRPQLRAELDRRIMASAQLIRLNRRQAIEKTLQRFSGWSTSIPAGGSDNVDRREEKATLKKALKQLPFEERRVLIDQGHKLTASIADIIAVDQRAIAVKWNSRWRQPGYNYREDHKERDGLIYLLRGCWAAEQGLIKPGGAGYYDQVTAFAEEPFCRCQGTYIYNLRDLPAEMLTNKGREALDEARRKARAAMAGAY